MFEVMWPLCSQLNMLRKHNIICNLLIFETYSYLVQFTNQTHDRSGKRISSFSDTNKYSIVVFAIIRRFSKQHFKSQKQSALFKV